ncbi:hypothetical protein D4764_0184810, partial [Takifugu flavidus]
MALHIRILLFTAVTVAPSCALQMRFSQKGGLFFYTISDGPAGADCDYSYYNATDHVIANNEEEASLVRNNSLDGLVALKCIKHLFFKATCSKGEFNSTDVTVPCEDLRSNEDAAKGINPVTKGNMHNSSGSSDQTVLVVVLAVLVVLVVLVVVLVICCKYKKKYGTNGGKNSCMKNRSEFMALYIRILLFMVKRELSQQTKLSIYGSSSFRPSPVVMSFGDRVRSSVIREELGVEPLHLRVERSQMRWLGHRVRVPPGRLPAAVTVAPSCALQMTFSQKGGLFFYNISDRPAGADCRYSYYNATNHPIAYIEEEASLVLNSSLDGLVTSECIGHLFFEVTCDKVLYTC